MPIAGGVTQPDVCHYRLLERSTVFQQKTLDFSFCTIDWARSVRTAFRIPPNDDDMLLVIETTRLLCSALQTRLPMHVSARIKDKKKHESWCLEWFKVNLERVAAAMVLAGHIVKAESLRCASRSTCLLKKNPFMAAGAFVEVLNESTGTREGSYLYFHQEQCQWIRSGKAVGQLVRIRLSRNATATTRPVLI